MAKTPVQVRLEDAEGDALDNYRRQQVNPPSRAQAARELMGRALSKGARRRAGELASSAPQPAT